MKNFGYLGLVRSSDFINGEQLASSIGLEEGDPQYTDCDWMHFILDRQELLVPTKTLRHTISWRDIYKKGAVYSDTEGFGPNPGGSGVNQNRYVTIGGSTYKVTLLKGGNEGEYIHLKAPHHVHPSLYDPESTWDSEWNKLMYRVHDGVHNPCHSNPVNASHPYGVWDQLSNTQLDMDYLKNGSGTASWCQNRGRWNKDFSSRRVVRGFCGVSSIHCFIVCHSDPNLGWRPTLRKV